MHRDNGFIEARFRRSKGREPRTQSVATRFTKAEEDRLLNAAAARGRKLREWAREALLTAADESSATAESSLFVEVQALRLLLINTLEPLLKGERMSADQFKDMLRYVRLNKRKAATDTLANYAEEVRS